ncbi:MarR family winged helix-turn-helix transcriptional regulator [Henriciella litoralis]|mgnify:FL=1|uniref:MarR family winged helix-turn-helix transcriptional regulator n=1 Tax=Henriciella litoralis TaxID=568102 RepID=UPI0009FDE894|nr:MarR family winged helix-turn-helix transcriptional regulator [Henriciella litoralis]
MSEPRNPRVYSRLQIAAQMLRKVTDRQLVEVAGITAAQLGVLNRIDAAHELNQTSLARDLRLNDSAITAMVKRLMTLGMIEKTRSQSDSRAWALKLTKNGETAIAKANSQTLSINARIEREFGTEGLKDFVAKLNRTIELCDEELVVEVDE